MNHRMRRRLICFWSATQPEDMLGYEESLERVGVHGFVGWHRRCVLTGVVPSAPFQRDQGRAKG